MDVAVDVVHPELPERPLPPRSLTERVGGWVRWVGPGRIVGASVVVLAVLAAGYWLVKPPAATSESKLPYAAPHTTTSTTAAADGGADAGAATTALASAAVVVVHVAGGVVHPGVYSLPEGARVIDAVQAAGGFAGGSLADSVNLAARLADGQRVYVPLEGVPVPVVAGDQGSGSGVTAGAGGGPVNINTASADELDTLPGVGPATAAAIIAHREQHGPFGSVEDLADVRGIGEAKLEALRGLVTV